jgi:hypothetical protein
VTDTTRNSRSTQSGEPEDRAASRTQAVTTNFRCPRAYECGSHSVQRGAPADRQSRGARRWLRSVADAHELGVALCDELGCDAGADSAGTKVLADRLTRDGSKHGRCCRSHRPSGHQPKPADLARSAARRRCRPYRPVVSSQPPPEPCVRVPPHTALHGYTEWFRFMPAPAGRARSTAARGGWRAERVARSGQRSGGWSTGRGSVLRGSGSG